MVEFTVPGLHGKDRPRTTKAGHVYTPEATKDYEARIRWVWRSATQGKVPPLEGPVAVTLKAFYPIPQSAPKAKRAKMLSGALRPQVKPDIDNVVKIALDALNGLAYLDDKQVVRLQASKHYVEGSGALYLRVEEVTP